MIRIEDIRNRTLSKHSQAVIHGLAGAQSEEAIEDQMSVPPVPKLKPEKRSDINEVEFYGTKVMEFYEYFSNHNSQSTAANLTLAAAYLKASVVLGGLIKDLTTALAHPELTIPVKLPYAGKKRGRKPKVK